MDTSTTGGIAAPSSTPNTTAEPTAPPGVVGPPAGQHLHFDTALLSVYPPDRDDRIYLSVAVHSVGSSGNVSAFLTRDEAEQFAAAICRALVS